MNNLIEVFNKDGVRALVNNEILPVWNNKGYYEKGKEPSNFIKKEIKEEKKVEIKEEIKIESEIIEEKKENSIEENSIGDKEFKRRRK